MDQPDWYLRKIKQLLLALREDELQHQGSNPAGSLGQASQQLHFNIQHGGGYTGLQNDNQPLITLKSLPGRGFGVTALRPILAGSIILTEKAILTLPQLPSKAITPKFISNLVDSYTQLPAALRQKFLSLHSYTRPIQEDTIRDFLDGSGESKLTEVQIDFVLRLHSIFATNSFEETTPLNSSLYLGASRFNHSCLPNCDYEHASEDNSTRITICSSRDIQSNEEMTIPYINTYESWDQRQAFTKLLWGFSCNCPACDVANPTVDTAVHEQMLAEYRGLEQGSCFKKSRTADSDALRLKYLDEGLCRSIRRAEISEALGDNFNVLREYVLSFFNCLSALAKAHN